MKSTAKLINLTIQSQAKNRVFYSSVFYHHHFPHLSEVNYYKVIERMTKNQELIKIGKGMFVVPNKSKSSKTLSEASILKVLLKRKSYMEIGYGLFNRLGLSTQVSKNRYFYVNKLIKPLQKVNQFYFTRKNLDFHKREFVEAIELLEVIQNSQKVQDLSMEALNAYVETSLKKINLENLKYVITQMRYKKRTVAFLNRLLETHKGFKNPLGAFLSQVSHYKMPPWGIQHENQTPH
jgi:hypothetical protein